MNILLWVLQVLLALHTAIGAFIACGRLAIRPLS